MYKQPCEYQAKEESSQRDQMLTDHRVVVFDVYVIEVFLLKCIYYCIGEDR